eukprot:365861-Chlamydomonas_euryale.AAC.44
MCLGLEEFSVGHDQEGWRANIPFAGTVAASLERSELWPFMQISQLIENMRMSKLAGNTIARASTCTDWESDLLTFGNGDGPRTSWSRVEVWML